jgi:hypothetical protein
MHLKSAALLALLIGGFGLGAPLARAIPVQGAYVIEAIYPDAPGPPLIYGCLVAGKDGQSETPSVYDWGVGGNLCGQPDGLISKQAIWDIYMVHSPAQQRSAYVIRSRFNGKCLIRGSSGTASNAMLYRWPSSSDTRFCGFPSADLLIGNGQAAWALDMEEEWFDFSGLYVFIGAIKMYKPTWASLSLSSKPATPPQRTPEVSLAAFSAVPTAWQFRLRTMAQYP